MQTKIHPKWYQATVTCSCGETFTVGATEPEIRVEICSVCHPFYTGQMKFIDAAGRVDAFKARIQKADVKKVSKTDKRKLKRDKKMKEEQARPETLAELR